MLGCVGSWVQLHPLTHAQFISKAHRSETKFEKGASDRNSPPGPLGIFIAKYISSGKFLLSTEQWPNMYIYMHDNKTGSVRGWNGNPGSQGHWQFTRIRKYTYIMSTAKWPDVYAYMQDTTDAYIMGARNNPGDKGEFILQPVVGFSDCKF